MLQFASRPKTLQGVSESVIAWSAKGDKTPYYLHNSIMEIHNTIMEIHNSIMEIHN